METKRTCGTVVKVYKPKKKDTKQMDDFDKYFEEKYSTDTEFKRVMDETETERDLGMTIAQCRINANMSQQELSRKTGVIQADISRIESAKGNPSLKTLKKIASGLGMKVKITFVPTQA